MVRTFAKLIFSLSLIIWLIYSDRLDFSLVKKVFFEGPFWIFGLLLIILTPLVTSLRWQVLVNQSEGLKFPYVMCVKLTWIGLFFNNFLPGAVTGDLIKLGYAKSINASISKTYLFTVIFVDRVFGMIGLLLIVGFFSLFQYQYLTDISPAVKNLIFFNVFLFFLVLIFFVLMFSSRTTQQLISTYLVKLPFVGGLFLRLFMQVWGIGKNRAVVFKAVVLSVFIQLMSLFAFWFLILPFVSDSAINFFSFVTFAPIGFMTIAIPISPSGLGVGHIAFDVLFSGFGVSDGASFFNLFFIFQVFVNGLGVIPYLKLPSKLS